MTIKPFLDSPEKGIKRYWRDNGDGETATIVTQQDVAPVIEHAKERANAQNYSAGRFMGETWGASAAIIPQVIIDKWLSEEGLDVWNPDHWSRLKAKLNDPDYAWLRTNRFRV